MEVVDMAKITIAGMYNKDSKILVSKLEIDVEDAPPQCLKFDLSGLSEIAVINAFLIIEEFGEVPSRFPEPVEISEEEFNQYHNQVRDAIFNDVEGIYIIEIIRELGPPVF